MKTTMKIIRIMWNCNGRSNGDYYTILKCDTGKTYRDKMTECLACKMNAFKIKIKNKNIIIL